MAQSTEENVMVKPRMTSPPPERPRSRRETLRFSPPSSCRDHLLRKWARVSQAAK